MFYMRKLKTYFKSWTTLDNDMQWKYCIPCHCNLLPAFKEKNSAVVEVWLGGQTWDFEGTQNIVIFPLYLIFKLNILPSSW